jgi:hypothetical protein
MSLYDTLRKNLKPDLFTQVTDQLGDDFDFDLVPRSRLNAVIKQRNALREQIAEGSQPSNNTKPGEDVDADDGDTPPDKKSSKTGKGDLDIEALKAQWIKEQGDAVKEVKMQYAALEKLRAAKAIDAELIWKAGMIDKSKLTVKDDGTIDGLDAIIADLIKNHANLFTAGGEPDKGTGKHGGSDEFSAITTKEKFLELPTDKQLAFKTANPEVFKTFLQQ